jgi:hypothetical protein
MRLNAKNIYSLNLATVNINRNVNTNLGVVEGKHTEGGLNEHDGRFLL